MFVFVWVQSYKGLSNSMILDHSRWSEAQPISVSAVY